MRCTLIIAIVSLAQADNLLSGAGGEELNPSHAAEHKHIVPASQHSLALQLRTQIRAFIESIPRNIHVAMDEVKDLLNQLHSVASKAYEQGTAAEQRAVKAAKAVAAKTVATASAAVEKLRALGKEAKASLVQIMAKSRRLAATSRMKLALMAKASRQAVVDGSAKLKSIVNTARQFLKVGKDKAKSTMKGAAEDVKATQAKLASMADTTKTEIASAKGEIYALSKEAQDSVATGAQKLKNLEVEAADHLGSISGAMHKLKAAVTGHASLLETSGKDSAQDAEMQRMIEEGGKVDLDDLKKKVEALNKDAVEQLDQLADQKERAVKTAMSLLQTSSGDPGLGDLAAKLQKLQALAQRHMHDFRAETRDMERKSREEMAIKREQIKEGTWPPTSFLQTSSSEDAIISPMSFMQTHSGMSAHQQAVELTKLNAARMLAKVQNSDAMKEWDANIHAKFQEMKASLHQLTAERKRDNDVAASSLIQTADTAKRTSMPSFAETEELENRDIAEMNAFKERNLAEIAAMRDGHHSVRDAIALAAQTQAGAAVQAAADSAAHRAAQPSSFLEEDDSLDKINAELTALKTKFKDGSFLQDSPDDSLLEKSTTQSKQDALVAKYLADFHAGFNAGLAKQTTTPSPDPESFLEGPDPSKPSPAEEAAAAKGIAALRSIEDASAAEMRTEQKMQDSREAYVKKLAKMVGPQNLAQSVHDELDQDLQHDQKVRDQLHLQLRQGGSA